ncbi:hypothetical protein ACF0H5_023632 [Mactra antiquata]
MPATNRKIESRDVGYGWLVVFSAFCLTFITDGLVFAFGIMLVEIVEQFEEGRASTGVIVSVASGTMHLIGPLAGALSDYYGCRIIVIIGSVISCVGFILSVFATNVYHLWITYGFLGGFGFGLMYIPANVCVLHNFKKQRTLANGIVVCGSGIGTFVFNLLTRFCIDTYGWRGTILLEAGIALQGAILGLFLVRITPPNNSESVALSTDERTDPQIDYELHVIQDMEPGNHIEYTPESQTNTKQTRQQNDDKINKSKTFIIKTIMESMFDIKLLTDIRCFLFLMSTFMINLAFTIPFNLLPDQALESGMTKYEASWLTSSIGITNTVSRLLIGWLGDRPFVNRMILSEVLLVLTGIITGLSPLVTTFDTKMIYTCLFGVLIGGYITLYGVLLVDLFGEDMISKSFGLVMFSVGISGFISTPIGGLLFDVTGNYNISFIVSGIEFVLGGLFLLLCKVCQPRDDKSHKIKTNFQCVAESGNNINIDDNVS